MPNPNISKYGCITLGFWFVVVFCFFFKSTGSQSGYSISDRFPGVPVAGHNINPQSNRKSKMVRNKQPLTENAAPKSRPSTRGPEDNSINKPGW